MNAYELFLEDLSEFKKDYSANLLDRLTTIRINYLKALKVLGTGVNGRWRIYRNRECFKTGREPVEFRE